MNIFLVYFDIELNGKAGFKTFIESKDKNSAKNLFEIKIKRDLKKINYSNIRIYQIKRRSYKGRYINDIHWEYIKKNAYPNSRHRLLKIKKTSWFKQTKFNKRNLNGTFKKGFTPWNKGLKMSFYKQSFGGKFEKPRNKKGFFKKGVKYKIIGCKSY